MEGVLLADKNYKVRSFVLTPVEQPLEVNEWQFNEAHANTYCLPDAIKLWKKRFKCLQNTLHNKDGNNLLNLKV